MELTNITCQDINECTGNTQHSVCNTGYELDGIGACNDINECTSNTHGCDQVCNNTIGSYECSCDMGYQLLTNGTCQDIDECLGNTHDCEQDCINNIGSYTCMTLYCWYKFVHNRVYPPNTHLRPHKQSHSLSCNQSHTHIQTYQLYSHTCIHTEQID